MVRRGLSVHVTHPLNGFAITAFHDGLDFVSVHEALVAELKTALATVRARQSIDQQVDTIARAKASRISDRRALFSVSCIYSLRLVHN